MTRTILCLRLDVTEITYIHDIPKSLCNSTQAKQSISRHPICLTDSDCVCVVEEIYRQNKIEYEIDVEVLSD